MNKFLTFDKLYHDALPVVAISIYIDKSDIKHKGQLGKLFCSNFIYSESFSTSVEGKSSKEINVKATTTVTRPRWLPVISVYVLE